jgi:hypothetical protein
MRWLAGLAVVVAACGTTAEPRENAASTPVPPTATLEHARVLVAPPSYAQAARPAIDLSRWVPDIETEARWPLGFNDHPIDEPSFAIAGALADPGVDWHSLCERGVQFRHLSKDQDLIAYLKVWCTADEADALYQLGLLRHTAIFGIAAAITPDIARIVVSHGSSVDVEGLLTRAHLLDAATVDLVAASYLELGRQGDALAMTELASQVDHVLTDATRCHRLVRAIASTTGAAQDDAAARLHVLGTPDPDKQMGVVQPRAPDATCKQLDSDVTCWRNPSLECARPGTDSTAESLLAAYGRWPTVEASFDDWKLETETAVDALPREDAYLLVLRSLGLEVATSVCNHSRLASIASTISKVRARRGTHEAELARLQSQIAELEGLSHFDCGIALRRMGH